MLLSFCHTILLHQNDKSRLNVHPKGGLDLVLESLGLLPLQGGSQSLLVEDAIVLVFTDVEFLRTKKEVSKK
jgi:hypothetical protein